MIRRMINRQINRRISRNNRRSLRVIVGLLLSILVMVGGYIVNLMNQPEIKRAIVINVVDGDTIDVLLNGNEQRVRFIGIDTPEFGEDGFLDAKLFTAREIEYSGNVVWLESSGRDTDIYGRLRRYVWLRNPDGSLSGGDQTENIARDFPHDFLLNQRLLDADLAIVWERDQD